ncbi:unnamed protein product [Coregonus sp. 'balchen']|nr:unnamed protein product [Coregonus sp. 'balchen']
MDPEVSVLLHCTAWGGLLEPQMQVELYARGRGTSETHKPPPQGAETEILLWAAEAQPCPQRDVGGKGERPTPILNLRLGLTYYRDFLGTNWSQRAMPVSGGGVWGSSGAIGSASGGGIPGGHPEPKPVFEGLDEEDRIRVEMLQRRDEAVETDRRQRFFHSSVEGNTTTTLRLKPPNHSSLWR